MTKTITYNGETFRVQTSGRYYLSDRKDVAERLLHRRVWHDHHGPIPAGMDVHHKDEDWRNSSITNLEAKPAGAHRSEHMHQRWRDAGQVERFEIGLAKARAVAADWHASEEGRLWHIQHGKDAWAKRETSTCQCERCGARFESLWSSARFCSTVCQRAVAFRRYFSEVRRCANCGRDFPANRHRKTECCSRACSNRRRAKPGACGLKPSEDGNG